MIRPAVPADRPRIEEIVEAAYSSWAELIGARPIPMDADYAALIEARQVFVTDPRLDGLIVLIPEDGALLVENVAVAPDRHGQGIGKALLAFAEDHARCLALPRLRLYTNELMTNNIALYEHLGYQGTSREDIGGRNVVHMAKDLHQSPRAMDEPTGDQAGQEAAHRRVQELRAEAEALAADPDDRAEAVAILKDMESLRVW